MASDQDPRGFLPPSGGDELHRQLSSTTTIPTGNNLPQTSPTTPKTTAGENTTPESQLAAALGRAIFTIPSISFRDAVAANTTVNTHNPIRRTVSDPSSSAYQQPSTTTTTPPKGTEPTRIRNPLRRTVSYPENTTTPAPKVPGARTVSPSPNSRTRKESPELKRLRKIEETVRDIEQRCWDVRRECEAVVVEEEQVGDDNSSQAIVEVKEECVAFETLDDGGLRFQLSCSCGKGFELLLKDKGCFYRLT